jgi:hypothetical protein
LRKVHNEELQLVLFAKYNYSKQVKEDEMGRVCSTHGEEKKNAYRLSVVKPEGKRPLGRPRCRWVYNIKIDLRERGWE